MLQLSAHTAILLATQPQDFRKGIDGFVALIRDTFKHNPKADIRFIFINRKRTMIRILAFDGNGYWLMTKRLSSGKFTDWPSSKVAIAPMLAIQLRTLLSGAIQDTTCTTKKSKKR